MTLVTGTLPSGTVTFLFTDVEGSTRLLHELGAEGYAAALAEHRRVLREAFAAHGGVEVDTQGDAFFVAFPTAPGALEAARQAQQALEMSVRMGIHTGTPLLTAEGYVGADVHKAARIAAAGHGRQVLVSAASAALLADELRDLGEHRLKDLSRAERIFQLGEGDFPPLKTLYRTNLPIPATPFIGRDEELGQVLDLLGGTRLLTLTGPGGTGKTRLALQAAAEASDRFPDGTFWVSLSSIRDPALVLEQAARAVGANDGLADYIADKRLLLLLDNFEQVIEAADTLAELQASCPRLNLLVTSREVLRLPGEQAYQVPPLDPDDGTRLFLARARAAKPDFEPDDAVSALCARLDNLPLALELAAARTSILSPAQLLERLSGRLDLLKAGRGVDHRQQTLRATIEWSHDLLDDEERRLFACLAVFRGGCTLEAAEAVCDAELDTLQSLVDKSLVRVRDEGRFWMLETIREFAAEQLEASGEGEELRRRHAEHFLELVELAEVRLRNEDPEESDRFEREHDNVRAALDRLEASGELDAALRLAGAAVWYWSPRGFGVEGRRRVERLLEGDARPTPGRAKALIAAAELAGVSGDPAAAGLRAEEALALYRRLGDRWGIAASLFLLGNAASIDADVKKKNEQLPEDGARLYREAQPFLEQSSELFDELGDAHFALTARYQLSYTVIELGDGERGKTMREDILRRARASGDEAIEALALGGLIRFPLAEERFEDALELLGAAIRIQVGLGNLNRVALLLGRFAYPLARLGRPETAAGLLAYSLVLFEQIGQKIPWAVAENEETLASIRVQLSEDEFDEAWETGRKLTRDEAVALALAEVRQAP
jgi:predicted ATPase